jgi:hypothetical protein
MESGEFVALLATEMLPVSLTAAAGAKVAVKAALCPGVMICPVETPAAVKPAPETVTLETVTLELPALVSATDWVLSLETFTLPKLKEDKLELRRNVAALTVSIAALLEASPALLLTATMNCALLAAVVSTGVVYIEEVAPLIGVPFLLH